MSHIVDALQQELAQLDAELERDDPRYRKIKHIRGLLAEYSGKSEPKPVIERGADEAETFSKKETVKREIEKFLRKEGSAHRSKILDMLVAKSLMGRESNPMQSLAIYLSGFSDLFVSEGQGVWRLK
jgi:hypothetical protein